MTRPHPLSLRYQSRPSRCTQRSAQPVAAQLSGVRRGLLSISVDRSAVLIASAASFGLISLDVFQSHLVFGGLDNSCHSWVVQHVPEELRKTTADKLISNSFFTLGFSGWAATSAVILLRQPEGALKQLLLAWAVYLAAAGVITEGDPPLVWTLKELFHRSRPSTLHHTFSFPSGHTTAATFLMGSLLFVLLPATLADKPGVTSSPSPASIESANESQASPQAPGDAPDATSSASAVATLTSDNQIQPSWIGNAALALWILSILTTACGRILADAHWLSDTMAGAALGTLLVSLLSRASRPQGPV